MVTLRKGMTWILTGGRRLLRLFARSLVVVLAVVVLLALSLTLPSVRGGLLSRGMALADRSLPGNWSVGRTAWPTAGHLVLEDVAWLTDGADTLAMVPRLEVVFSWSALRRHDLVVDSLVVAARRIDVPGITRLFPARADTGPAASADTVGAAAVPWLREGAAEGLPSLLLRRLEIRVDHLAAAPGLVLDGARVVGSLDGSHGGDGLAAEVRGHLEAALAGDHPVFLDLKSLDLVARYGPAAGAVRLDSLALTAVGGPTDQRATLEAAGPVRLATVGKADLDLSADLAGGGFPLRAALNGNLDGPLSALWGDAWPEALDAADYRHASLAFDLEAEGSVPGSLAASLFLDLAGTDGVEQGVLKGWGRFDPASPGNLVARLDTLDLALAGCRAAGHGAVDDSTLSLELDLHAATPLPMLALAGPEFATADLALDLDVSLAGTKSRPTGRAGLTLRYRDDLRSVETVEILAEGGLSGATARVKGRGLVVQGSSVMDSLDCTVSYGADREWPLTLAARGQRGTEMLTVGLSAVSDSSATVRLDSLELLVGGMPIRLESPTTVMVDTASGTVALETLVLAGPPGRLELEGSLRSGDVDLKANMDLLFTEAMLEDLAPGAPWNRDGGADLALTGDVELGGSMGVPVFRGAMEAELRPHRDRPRVGARLDLHLAGEEDPGLAADLAITADDTLLLRGSAFVPGRMDPEVGGWRPDPERDLRLEVPQQQLAMAHLRPFLLDEMSVEGAVRLAALVRWPLGTRHDQSPDSTGSLEASLEAETLHMVLPNRSRLDLTLDCRLAGTPQTPRLEGDVTVESGFIRIPEMPQSLHPTEGTSHLWQAAGRDSALTEAALGAQAAPRWEADREVVAPIMPLPDMDLRVHMPGNLRLNGYGLDAELDGDFTVSRGMDDKGRPGPSLQGKVGIVRGSLRFMNRQFEIDRGDVGFTGDVPPNPELGLSMWTRTGGYRVMIGVSGRADDPVVDLTSEPDLQKSDVVAVLLFGRPLNDLDTDQRGRVGEENDASKQLQENLAGLALVFGTKGLQDSMTSTLGVDMVEIGSDSEGGATLAAGKYINSTMLLKYHQSLEKSGTYYMTLEYILSQAFRLVTTYGQGEEASGVELKWERRY